MGLRKVSAYVPTCHGKTLGHLSCGHWCCFDDARTDEHANGCFPLVYFCRWCERESQQRDERRRLGAGDE